MDPKTEHSLQEDGTGAKAHHMPALTGVRFFAIFHIFLFHLFAWFWASNPESVDGADSMLSGLENAPDVLLKFASNGWMSTSFFFLLSGFILAYLYWGEDGRLVSTRRQFWLRRAARIYPIHWIVLLITLPGLISFKIGQGMPLSSLVPSAAATVTLMQAWVPSWVPMWSWPTWTISVLMFLYLIMPWLMKTLSRWSRRQMIMLLVAMPVLSILPAVVYALRMVSGAEESMNVDIFVANFPPFWVPYFVAGMLMSRIFSLSRFNPSRHSPSWFSAGDLAIIAILVVATTQYIDQPWKFLIRQGFLMPAYMLIVFDLARGKGLFAKLFSQPGMGFLGETGFSIFIWQNFIVMALYVSLMVNPAIGPYQHWLAIITILVLAIASTYLIEKPIARWLRRRFIDRSTIGEQ